MVFYPYTLFTVGSLNLKVPGSNPALVRFSWQFFGFETPTCQFLSYLFHHFLQFGEACLEKLRAPSTLFSGINLKGFGQDILIFSKTLRAIL